VGVGVGEGVGVGVVQGSRCSRCQSKAWLYRSSRELISPVQQLLYLAVLTSASTYI